MTDSTNELRPWYKEPWPWVAIAIPATAVIAGAITFYLAVSNPDYRVVEDDQYQEIGSGLRAQSPSDPKLDSAVNPEVAPEADSGVDPEAGVGDDKGKL
jgi:hypothetical protein